MQSHPLNEQQIHLWTANLEFPDDIIEKHYQILDEHEKARADRFYFPKHRRRFIMAHSALRHILASYTGVLPEDHTFTTEARGKPKLNSATDLQFNLSHSEEKALIGITLQNAIGVDIEHHREIELQSLAKSQFSSQEYTDLITQPLDQQQQKFFDIWAMKEAFIKAIGLGLYCSLQSFSVSLEKGGFTHLPAEYQSQAWNLDLLELFAEYSVAICYEGSKKNLRVINFLLNSY